MTPNDELESVLDFVQRLEASFLEGRLRADAPAIITAYRASIKSPLKAEIERLREALVKITGLGLIGVYDVRWAIATAALAASPAEPERGPEVGDVVWHDTGLSKVAIWSERDESFKHLYTQPTTVLMRRAELDRRIGQGEAVKIKKQPLLRCQR